MNPGSAGRIEVFDVLEFILEAADAEELAAIEMALEKRRKRGPLESLHFGAMAKRATAHLNQMMPDVKNMTRQMVANIILEHEPGMNRVALETLLDHYVPDPATLADRERQRERQLPPEVLQRMIRQFVAYSLGRMPSDEEKELRDALPDWPRAYWETFSPETRKLIKGLIEQHGV
jgi:hypothetical protein